MGVSKEPLDFNMGMVLKRVRILGSSQNGPEYLYEALDDAAKGKVKVVAKTYKLDDIGKAYDRVAEGKVRFRTVISSGLVLWGGTLSQACSKRSRRGRRASEGVFILY